MTLSNHDDSQTKTLIVTYSGEGWCLPVSGYVTVSSPIPHATAGLCHPLRSLVRVWNTYSNVLCFLRTLSVMILAEKTPVWQMAPKASRGIMTFLHHKFIMKGTTVAAYMIIVKCHRSGV